VRAQPEPLDAARNAARSSTVLAQVADGTSKTFALAESREKTAAAWIDGARNWVTAAKFLSLSRPAMTKVAPA
jgi:hypothetical protein